MIKNALKLLIAFSLFTNTACSQDQPKDTEIKVKPYKVVKVPSHSYGGWYCPDNLKGFPAVNIVDWNKVPVVNGRMATKEETRNGTSLIHVDLEKYPNAKTLDIKMPKLAYFESPYTNRTEIIIVIQALNIENDSVVGFRYLNGGNGSARLDEITFIEYETTKNILIGKFVTGEITINATSKNVREIMLEPANAATFRKISPSDESKSRIKKKTNVNYSYSNAGELTSEFANDLFGNFYVQNDYDNNSFTEKFLLLEQKSKDNQILPNKLKIQTKIQYVVGPFDDDFEKEKTKLTNWIAEVKQRSEKL